MDYLVKNLIKSGVLKTPRIIQAFRVIDRKDFVTDEYKNMAYEDTALPIGFGQTISQPYTVAFMLELLEPQPGDKVMDVGSGSGWQTALLAHSVGSRGKIFAIELVPELKAFGDRNLAQYDFIKKGIVTNLQMNAENGIPQEAPFDRIIAGAATREVPHAWKEQLKTGGKIVMPIKNSIWCFTKKPDGSFEEEKFPDFAFVPFVHV